MSVVGSEERGLPRGEAGYGRGDPVPAPEHQFIWSLMKRALPETHAPEFLYGGARGDPGDMEGTGGELGPA